MFVFDLTREHATPFELSNRLTVINLPPPPGLLVPLPVPLPLLPLPLTTFPPPPKPIRVVFLCADMRSGEAGEDNVGDDGVGLDRCPLVTFPPLTMQFSRFASLVTCVEPPLPPLPPLPIPPLVRPANEDDEDEAETSEAGLERAVGDEDDDDAADENMGDMMIMSARKTTIAFLRPTTPRSRRRHLHSYIIINLGHFRF